MINPNERNRLATKLENLIECTSTDAYEMRQDVKLLAETVRILLLVDVHEPYRLEPPAEHEH